MKRPDDRLKILLSEGSSTSARQALYGLSRDYVVDIVDPSPWCQCRFSSRVRRWHRCPLMARDPVGYVAFVADLLRRQPYDVLLPTHEQVYLFARFRHLLGSDVAIALPEFESLKRLQGKADFVRLLSELSLPIPRTVIAQSESELLDRAEFPCYVKLAHSTASLGVQLVDSRQKLIAAIDHFKAIGLWSTGGEVLIQQPAPGVQSEVYAVFQHGRLVASAGAKVLETGIGGGPSRRVSVSRPEVVDHVRRLGSFLNWHGPLSMEYFYDEQHRHPRFIEANPRIGETVNALLSGVPLCELVVQVSLGKHVEEAPAGKAGIKTYSGFIVLLAAAYNGANRRQLLRHAWRIWTGQGGYARCQNEMTRPRDDWGSLIPAAATLSRVFALPRSARGLSQSTIYNYSLPQSAVSAICQLPEHALAEALRDAADGDPAGKNHE